MAIDAIKYRAQSGFPGDLTRPNAPFTVMPKVGASVIDFGAPVVEDGATVRAVLGTDTAISGFATRPYPIASHTYPNAAIGSGGFVVGQVVDVIKDGYVAVKVLGTDEPANGGDVFVQVTAAPGLPVGSIVAATSADTITVSGAKFSTGRDASGVAEVHVAIV